MELARGGAKGGKAAKGSSPKKSADGMERGMADAPIPDWLVETMRWC